MSRKPIAAQQAANDTVFEEFFQDYYSRRRQIYWMNFIRGIFFGFGSLVGGTLVVAAALWLLSAFHQVPFLTDVVETVQHSIEEAKLRN